MVYKKLILNLCIALFLVTTLIFTSAQGMMKIQDVNIVNPIESNGGIPVNLQDQTTQPLDLYFSQEIGSRTNLTNNISIDQVNITLNSVASVSIGNAIGIFSGISGEGRFYFGEVLAINGNNVTLDTPIDFNFSAGDEIISTTREINVDGSSLTQAFVVRGAGVGSPLEIDITRIMFQMTDNSAMDDGTFGGISSLTNGIVLRRNNGQVNNIYNIKNNGDFGLVAYDVDYSDKAPAGTFGLSVRSTFAGQDKHGVAIRLGGGDDALELLVRDDLTELTSFRILAQGHIVTD